MKKKCVLFCFVSLFLVVSLGAEISIGARGNFNVGAGARFSDDVESNWFKYSDVHYSPVLGGGFNIYVNFSPFNVSIFSFGIQPEIGINFNEGCKFLSNNGSREEMGMYCNFVDIPVLITAKAAFNKFDLLVGAGIQLGFPFGGHSVFFGGEFAVADYDMQFKYPDVGFLCDVGFLFKVHEKIKLCADIRYMTNFKETRLEINPNDFAVNVFLEDFFLRRTLTFSFSVEFLIKKIKA